MTLMLLSSTTNTDHSLRYISSYLYLMDFKQLIIYQHRFFFQPSGLTTKFQTLREKTEKAFLR